MGKWCMCDRTLPVSLLAASHNFFITAHKCKEKGCGEVLVLDGNQKNNRPVCGARDAGFMEYEGLPGSVKTGCMNTPEQKSLFCTSHKPRHMKSLGTSSSQDDYSVIEVILSKKATRNNTFYEASSIQVTCTHELFTTSF